MTKQTIRRLVDAQMAFPDILLAILMVAAPGSNALNLIIALGISRWCPALEIPTNFREQQATENRELVSRKFYSEFPNQDTRALSP